MNLKCFYCSVIWTTTIILCASYLAYTLNEEIKKYYRYPTMTRRTVELKTEMKFPAVTICNLSKLNKSRIVADTRRDNYEMSLNLMEHFSVAINWSDPVYKQQGYFEPITPQYVTDVSMQTHFIMENISSFDGKLLPYVSPFVSRLTALGVCYTFNADDTVRTSLSGSHTNLMVSLYVDQPNYYWSTDNAAGVKVSREQF
jgi:hypothetical protein